MSDTAMISLPLPQVKRLAPPSADFALCAGTCTRARYQLPVWVADLQGGLCPECRMPERCDGCRLATVLGRLQPLYGARLCDECLTQATVDADAGTLCPIDAAEWSGEAVVR